MKNGDKEVKKTKKKKVKEWYDLLIVNYIHYLLSFIILTSFHIPSNPMRLTSLATLPISSPKYLEKRVGIWTNIKCATVNPTQNFNNVLF